GDKLINSTVIHEEIGRLFHSDRIPTNQLESISSFVIAQNSVDNSPIYQEAKIDSLENINQTLIKNIKELKDTIIAGTIGRMIASPKNEYSEGAGGGYSDMGNNMEAAIIWNISALLEYLQPNQLLNRLMHTKLTPQNVIKENENTFCESFCPVQAPWRMMSQWLVKLPPFAAYLVEILEGSIATTNAISGGSSFGGDRTEDLRIKSMLMEGLTTNNFDLNDNIPDEPSGFVVSKEDEDVHVLVLIRLKSNKKGEGKKKRQIGIRDVNDIEKKCLSLGSGVHEAIYGAIVTNFFYSNKTKVEAEGLGVLLSKPNEGVKKLSRFIDSKINKKKEEALTEFILREILEKDDL
ncbi:22515_t:CDS:2, partial [Gigaspora margarita]